MSDHAEADMQSKTINEQFKKLQDGTFPLVLSNKDPSIVETLLLSAYDLNQKEISSQKLVFCILVHSSGVNSSDWISVNAPSCSIQQNWKQGMQVSFQHNNEFNKFRTVGAKSNWRYWTYSFIKDAMECFSGYKFKTQSITEVGYSQLMPGQLDRNLCDFVGLHKSSNGNLICSSVVILVSKTNPQYQDEYPFTQKDYTLLKQETLRFKTLWKQKSAKTNISF